MLNKLIFVKLIPINSEMNKSKFFNYTNKNVEIVRSNTFFDQGLNPNSSTCECEFLMT